MLLRFLKNNLKTLFLFLSVLALIGTYAHWYTRSYIDQFLFDTLNDNVYLNEKEDIGNILSKFKKVPLKQLPPEYLNYTNLQEKKYKNLLKDSHFFLVPRKQVNRKIVGNIRIKDLMPKDKYFRKGYYFSGDTLIWGIDERILLKILDLQNKLDEKGYDRDAFWIRNGHRHPRYNTKVGGASKSRHIKGEAVDMVIQDINKDGAYSDEDKQIVIDLCERYIIKNNGGIGKYPNTRTVHIDVRGYKARWDSY